MSWLQGALPPPAIPPPHPLTHLVHQQRPRYPPPPHPSLLVQCAVIAHHHHLNAEALDLGPLHGSAKVETVA